MRRLVRKASCAVTCLVGVLTLLVAVQSWGALPAGWASQDLGNASLGSAVESGGTWTVAGRGSDIWTTSDNCHFAYREINGDFDISCRLASVAGGADAWRKAGLMARVDMVNSTRMVMTTIAPFQAARGRHFYHRNSDGASISSEEHQIQTVPPIYIRLARSGQTFSSYGSTNGTDWVQIGNDYTYVGGNVMPDTLYVGFAVTAHNTGQTATGTFDDLKGLPILNDAGATAIAMASASLDAELVETNGPTYVQAYWGLSDGGTNMSGAGAWGNVVDFTAPQAIGPLSTNITGLTPDTQYFYRYYATNAVSASWAPMAASFFTLSGFSWDGDTDDMWGTAANWAGGNVPNMPGEFARFSGVGAGPVDLGGSSYTVDFVEFMDGDYVVTNSGAAATLTAGTLIQEAGDNSLEAAVTVTGTTTVAGGTLTLADAGNFGTGDITLSGGKLRLWGEWQTGVARGALVHYGYNHNTDAELDLNGNGGLMAITPDGQATLVNGPGSRGLDFNSDADFTGTGAVSVNDNYMNLFIGSFQAPETGDHQFRINQDDDRCGIWIDLDQDGVFESTTAGLGSDRGEQLVWENYVVSVAESAISRATFLMSKPAVSVFTAPNAGGSGFLSFTLF